MKSKFKLRNNRSTEFKLRTMNLIKPFFIKNAAYFKNYYKLLILIETLRMFKKNFLDLNFFSFKISIN